MNAILSKKELMVPCLRATMGDWIYYVSLMKFEDIAERIKLAKDIHKHSGLKELLQRTLTDRSFAIGEYLCSQKQHFFNAIIAGIYLGDPTWNEIEVGGNERISADELPVLVKDSIGILSLSGNESIFAIDGQHRVEGIKNALGKKKGLGNDEQTVIFVAHKNSRKGIERTRRLFSTLNRYAKPVTLAEIIALDEDDVVAITTRELLERHELLSQPDIIHVSKVKTVHRSNKKCLTSVHALYEVLDIILFSDKDVKKKLKYRLKKLRPSDDILNEYYKKADYFWNLLINNFPPLQLLLDSGTTEDIAGNYRHNNGGHLLFRPAGITSIAVAVRKLMDNGKDLVKIISCISQMEMELHHEPWSGLLWESGSKRMIMQKKNRNIASKLIIYMTGIDLSNFNIDESNLINDYTSALNRPPDEIEMPERQASDFFT